MLQEIVETEKTFVTNLSGFYHGYVESIRLCDTPLKREIMGTHEIALLFSNLEQIVDLNTDMLKRLQIVIKSWDEKVGGQGGDGARIRISCVARGLERTPKGVRVDGHRLRKKP